MPNPFLCPNCGAEIPWSADLCLKCKHPVGPPNKRELQTADERAALTHRYDHARRDADRRGALNRVDDFETKVEADSRAVVNLWPSFLAEFLNDGRTLYSNYNLQVRSEQRTSAAPKDDRQRRATEALLFGGYADQIRYGALALDDKGLTSYGSCSMSISNVTAEASATLLEENSYGFVRRHRVLPGDDIPRGFRALWEDRHKLVVAKLASGIHARTRTDTFPRTVLYSDGNRAK